eukprot:74097-Rhodomonas_salina.2
MGIRSLLRVRVSGRRLRPSSLTVSQRRIHRLRSRNEPVCDATAKLDCQNKRTELYCWWFFKRSHSCAPVAPSLVPLSLPDLAPASSQPARYLAPPTFLCQCSLPK